MVQCLDGLRVLRGYVNDYFYIYLYDKNKNDTINFFLNGVPALMAEKLPVSNEFTHLTSFKSKWNKYYLVGFQKQEGVLNLDVQLGNISSYLVFKKVQ